MEQLVAARRFTGVWSFTNMEFKCNCKLNHSKLLLKRLKITSKPLRTLANRQNTSTTTRQTFINAQTHFYCASSSAKSKACCLLQFAFWMQGEHLQESNANLPVFSFALQDMLWKNPDRRTLSPRAMSMCSFVWKFETFFVYYTRKRAAGHYSS